MANPQCDKYLKLSLEIIDAFCRFRVPGEVMQIVWVVIRKTYGWHKKTDRISNSQFIHETGMNKGNVSRSITKALEHQIIYKTFEGKYGLQKDFDAWIPFKTVAKVQPDPIGEISCQSATKVINTDNNPCAQMVAKVRDTKDITKDTLQKKGFNNYSSFNLEPIPGCDF